MTALLLRGKDVAKTVKAKVKADVAALVEKGITPGLAVVLVGEDPASQVYVKSKIRTCEKLGIYSKTLRYPADISQKELNDVVDSLNADEKIHGILVQMPLPKHLDENEIIMRILPEKDVDGFHPISVGKLVLNQDTFISCTPGGIMEIFDFYNISLSGKHVVIVGRSNIVGKPMLNLLYQKTKGANATVTICHTGTKDLASFTKQADVLIAAAGAPEMIKADMLKPGCIVIDVGINRIDDESVEKGYRLVGDVDFKSVSEIASSITPVPGGVGVMTIAMLMSNTVKAAQMTL